MTHGVAEYIRNLDPRLKMGVALALGPSIWALGSLPIGCLGAVLLGMVVPLSVSQPLGKRMIRSLFVFTFFWVGIKVVLDVFSDMPASQVAMGGADLAIRLVALLLLGLSLALSTSPRSLGLAVSWGLRPIVGGERAWKIALSLALMVHFLPICLSTMGQVQEMVECRIPGCGLRHKLTIVPLAVIRNLGQKTWNQTLAVAGRGLESSEAWEPDFSWSRRDSVWLFIFLAIAFFLFLK